MDDKPNVLFILVDDMGYGDFSAFNDEITETRALDSLVEDGMVLRNCYSSSPVCAPARASIMTGRYPQKCGVIDTLEARGYDRLKLSETTMADIFKHNNYYTGLIGKWHLGAIDQRYHPNQRGFDYFMGFRGGWNDYFDYHIERNGQELECQGKYLTDVFSDDAVKFIEDNCKQPFFLHLAYNAPHFPLQAPEEAIQKYRKLNKYTEAVCKIYAMLEIMDDGIGRILNKLEECGIGDKTIVVFASDNGPDFGGTGEDSQKRFNCDLKGEKMLVYEGGIKVPAVVKWTKEIPAGEFSDGVIHGIDWLPTLMSACNLTYPKKLDMDGIDVLNTLKGEDGVKRELYWQWNRHKPELMCNGAVRSGDWKLVHAPVYEYLDLPEEEVNLDNEIKYHPERFQDLVKTAIDWPEPLETAVVELYNLEKDFGEKNNLAAQEMGKTQSLEKKFKQWFNEVEKERLS